MKKLLYLVALTALCTQRSYGMETSDNQSPKTTAQVYTVCLTLAPCNWVALAANLGQMHEAHVAQRPHTPHTSNDAPKSPVPPIAPAAPRVSPRSEVDDESDASVDGDSDGDWDRVKEEEWEDITGQTHQD